MRAQAKREIREKDLPAFVEILKSLKDSLHVLNAAGPKSISN